MAQRIPWVLHWFGPLIFFFFLQLQGGCVAHNVDCSSTLSALTI